MNGRFRKSSDGPKPHSDSVASGCAGLSQGLGLSTRGAHHQAHFPDGATEAQRGEGRPKVTQQSRNWLSHHNTSNSWHFLRGPVHHPAESEPQREKPVSSQ